MWAAHPRRMGQQVTCRIVMGNKGRKMAVPLSQLTALDAGKSTTEAIGDWHYLGGPRLLVLNHRPTRLRSTQPYRFTLSMRALSADLRTESRQHTASRIWLAPRWA